MIDMTHNLMYRLDNLNNTQNKLTYQKTTGNYLNNGSEDARQYNQILYVEDKINMYNGIKSQVDRSITFNNAADTSMAEIKKLLTKVKTELQKGVNDTTDDSGKEAIASQLEGIKQNLFSLANQESGGEYVFAGSDTTKKPFTMDQYGKVSYVGDGYLKKVAIDDGEYRDRGITGFDAMMYTSSKAYNGEKLNFAGDERLIDESGNEWKLSITNVPVMGDGVLTKYDRSGNATEDTKSVIQTTPKSSTRPARYELAEPLNEMGKSLEAKHNIFDDLDRAILALRHKQGNGDPTGSEQATKNLLNEQVANFQSAFEGANVGHAKLGGRNTVIKDVSATLTTKMTELKLLQKSVKEVDLTSVEVRAKQLELIYTSFFSSIVKLNQMSLINFMK